MEHQAASGYMIMEPNLLSDFQMKLLDVADDFNKQ
jgi:hypothetical protein